MTNLVLLDPTIIESDEPRTPIVWGVEDNFRFEDVVEARYDEVIDFLVYEYIKRDIIPLSLNLKNDPVGIEEYRALLLGILKYDCSIACIDQETDKLAGVLVGEYMSQENMSWAYYRLTNLQSQLLSKLAILEYQMMKFSDVDEQYDTSETFHIFHAIIGRNYKGRFLKESLFRNAYKLSRSLGAKLMSYIACSNNDYERALRFGMIDAYVAHYGNYFDENGKLVFPNMRSKEYSAHVMIKLIGPQHFMSLTEQERLP